MTTPDTTMTPAGLPLGMAPAPAPQQQTLTPINLGKFDKRYANWLVVIDPDVPVGTNSLLAGLADKSVPAEDKLRIMEQWVSAVVLYWNFTIINEAGERIVLPQPRDGGAKFCPQTLFQSLLKAEQEATTPPNASGSE